MDHPQFQDKVFKTNKPVDEFLITISDKQKYKLKEYNENFNNKILQFTFVIC